MASVYPSTKPNPQPPLATTNGGRAPTFPPAKSQLYGTNRPAYRPQPPKRRRSRRRCCCVCFLWLALLILALIFLAAIAGGIFYLVYRPHRPTFSVSSLRLSTFNISNSGNINSKLDIAVTAHNPNRKISFLYSPISISAFSEGVDVGEGEFPAFLHEPKNTTLMKATVTSSSNGQTTDSSTASNLKKKTNIPLQIQMETKAGVKVGGLSTKRVGIRVTCDGINAPVSKGKSPVASNTEASCKAKLRIKIWKWTF